MKKLILALLSLPIFAFGAAQPPGLVNAVVGFAPGSGNELSFRGLSTIVQKTNPNYNYIIENKPGADGTLGMNAFIDLPNDGNNIYIASHQGIWVTADYFASNAKRYTLDDFEYGLTLAKSPLVVIANASSVVNTPAELIKYLKESKLPITFAAGSGAHKLAYDYMMNYIKGDTNLIRAASYKGPAQAAIDVAGGHTEFGIIPVAVASPLLKSGKIKLIGLCSSIPLPAMPDAKLMTGDVPGMEVYAAWGIIFPKGTSPDVINWYVNEYTKAIKSDDGKKFLFDNLMFSDPKELTPDGFKASMMALRARWIPILDKLNLSKQ